jgi:hypothetical protein
LLCLTHLHFQQTVVDLSLVSTHQIRANVTSDLFEKFNVGRRRVRYGEYLLVGIRQYLPGMENEAGSGMSFTTTIRRWPAASKNTLELGPMVKSIFKPPIWLGCYSKFVQKDTFSNGSMSIFGSFGSFKRHKCAPDNKRQ